jgi:AAHS family 4-hydroxybenzoate transporter-like MFS transporter
VSCGFTVGGVVGGFAAAALIPAFGWRSVFVVGGVIPAIAFVLMLFLLPESMQFLLAKKKRYTLVGALLKRIQPDLVLGSSPDYLLPEDRQERAAPVAQLFMRGRSTFTLLIWLVNFVNLIDLYFLMSWMPTIARDTGLSMSSAVLLGTMFPIGGIAGTLLIGPLVDRLGFYKVLGTTFATAAVSIFMIGQVANPVFAFAAVAVSGFCIIGSQAAINILAADYYPTALRSTGVGWSLGAGRVGSIAGPVVGGILMSRNWSNGSLFAAVAVPAVISAVTMALLSTQRRKPSSNSGGRLATSSSNASGSSAL